MLSVAITQLDNDGNIVVKYVYDAWGNQKIVDCNGNEVVGTNHIGNLNPFRYRSYYYDIETNLYFLKTRYYDPEICRFTTIDDLKYLRPDTINGINLYAYCRNNPIIYIDETGNWPKWISSSINWINDKIVQPVVAFVNNVIEDINNYSKYNDDEDVVLKSNYFSSYRGKFVIRTNMERSGSLGILFISHKEEDEWDKINTVKHEYGHTEQLQQMGLLNYLILIGYPSWQKLGPESYYRKPWEITADIYGGVDLYSRIYDDPLTPSHINNGYTYLEIASSDLSIWDKINKLKVYY